MNNPDRIVSQYMLEWQARGLPVESQYIQAKAFYRAGALSDHVAEQLEGVQNYLVATGGWVLRETGKVDHALNDFFSGSGISEAGDQVAGESLESVRRRYGM